MQSLNYYDRVKVYEREVRQILMDNVSAGFEMLSPEEIEGIKFSSWHDTDGNIICILPPSLRRRLKSETLIEIDLIKV